ncbi:hypothetical protein [Paracoccus binzhouensis]|uniref:hypothetical protein n=1 Tax=Paracoccus binzhouensis TaxID=2796149 RepID=UPI0018EF210C|nr:hypothetical protein [Paracoccus binzhouensis]
MLEEIARNAEPCPGSPLQTYIADRIAGRPGPTWLDCLPLEQSIRVTELPGTALEFGPDAAFDDLSAQDQDAASTCGWAYTSEGKSGSVGHSESSRPAAIRRRCRGGAANGTLSARCGMNATILHRVARPPESSKSISRARRNPDPRSAGQSGPALHQMPDSSGRLRAAFFFGGKATFDGHELR